MIRYREIVLDNHNMKRLLFRNWLVMWTNITLYTTVFAVINLLLFIYRNCSTRVIPTRQTILSKYDYIKYRTDLLYHDATGHGGIMGGCTTFTEYVRISRELREYEAEHLVPYDFEMESSIRSYINNENFDAINMLWIRGFHVVASRI